MPTAISRIKTMSHQYQLDNIQFAYTDKSILNIKHQTIEAGKVTSLLGANGAGKSTMLGILAFILKINSGELTFAGQLVHAQQSPTLRKKIGIVQQNPYLISASARKNIELGLRFHGIPKATRTQKTQHILQLLNIEYLANRPAKALSGGEAQKIAIARTLVLEPDVILLDEPFTHIDNKFTEELKILIKYLRDEQHKTIIFTTHDRSHVQELSDHTLALIDGNLIAS